MEENQMGCCMICGDFRMDGIWILSEFICDYCESEIVQTDVLDDKYPFFIYQMRQLFQKNA
jgi:hypothetical protein